MYIEINSIYQPQEYIKIPALDPTVLNKPFKNTSISQPESPLDQELYEQLNQLFSEQDLKRKTVIEAREILGESADNLTDEQVYNLVTTVKFLIDTWSEEFERSIFDGKTFNELLNLSPI